MTAEGQPVSYEQFLESFGQKNDRILARWLGPGADAGRIRRVGDAKEALYRRMVEEGRLAALPGAAPWVRRLHAGGWLQAIASSAPRENITVMLRALGVEDRFDAIVSAEDVAAGKPDPQVFLVAAARLGLAPARCIVVEDAAAGVEAARRAGIRCIGVSRGAPLPADLAAASLEELPDDAFDRLLEGCA
jgi:beta-phosphoglucomutase